MSTLTDQQVEAIRLQLDGMHLPVGVGSGRKEACSVAAINLALTGVLTDQIPDCMSLVVGQWIIRIQDAMPDAMRNSLYWRELLPYAAGTGREREQERLDLILDWMWGTVLPTMQPVADARGLGAEWRQMSKRRATAFTAANAVANAAAHAAAAAAAHAAAAAAAHAAAHAAAAYADATADFWAHVSPPDLLAKLVAVG